MRSSTATASLSVFGTLYQACEALTPRVDQAQAATIAAKHVRLVGRNPLTLVAMPQANGACVPAYAGRGVSAVGPVTVFVNGLSGAVTHETLRRWIETVARRRASSRDDPRHARDGRTVLRAR